MKHKALFLLPALTGALCGQSGGLPPIQTSLVLELWYTQVLNNNLRLDNLQTSRMDGASGQPAYYQFNSAFQENGFSVRRAEIGLSQEAVPGVSWQLMFDPNTSTSNTAPTTLQDASIVWQISPSWLIRAGQMKPLQTYEASLVSSADILFFDRSQMARHFADKRDRGLVATFIWGRPEGLAGRMNLGIFNGSTDRDAGKANDVNPQKDLDTRFQFTYGAHHKFGFYNRLATSDVSSKPPVIINAFTYAGAAGPSNQTILDYRDNAPHMGAYYVYEDETWIANVEAIRGRLGRRFASIGIALPAATPAVPNPATPAALRQHLEQRFLGYETTLGWKRGRHTFLVRYDFMDYNQGNLYYGPYNPYTTNTKTGAPLGADYTPRYTESTVGWDFAFVPNKLGRANLKVDYVHRSRNFLIPRSGQFGAQGGDSLVMVFKVGF
jgi:hypothetical protein